MLQVRQRIAEHIPHQDQYSFWCKLSTVLLESQLSTQMRYHVIQDEIRDLSFLMSHPLLSREEEIKLCKLYRRGDNKARDQFILSNARLVMKEAIRYRKRAGSPPLVDLVAAGMEGMIRNALTRFDPDRVTKFGTMATHWIRRAIKDEINRNRPTRLPSRMCRLIPKMSWATAMSYRDHGDADPDHIADKLGISRSYLDYVVRSHKVSQPVSIPEGEQIGGNDDLHEQIESKEESGMLHDAISNLRDRERKVLYHRFGLMGRRPMTLEDIGKVMNISRERVRQIEKRAISKLRTSLAGLA